MKTTIRPRLTYRSDRRGEPVGVWMRSVDPRDWIDLLIANEGIAAYRLPGEEGLIAVSTDGKCLVEAPDSLQLVQLSLPTLANTALWTPANSELQPRVPESWLSSALPSGTAIKLVWLPRLGLVVFEDSDRIVLADLLAKPHSSNAVSESAGWSSPPEVAALPTRFAGIVLRDELSIDDVLGQHGIGGSGAGIGEDARELGELDRSTRSHVDKWKAWLLNKLDGEKEDAQDQSPESSNAPSTSPPNKTNSDTGAFKSFLQGILSEGVKKERDSQLSKLLQMTKLDPDKALRFAIPLTGSNAFRGLAIPGAKLMSRLPNFSISSLGGAGGPADFWNVDPSIRAKLIAAYNEMANREMAAGRYRRAAYIHANLLGNLSAAASVLEQGGFYQEAAVLYRDKLNRPADEARCWMAAGWFEKAADIFTQLNDYENASDAWRRAGKDDFAKAALEKAVESLISRHLILDAANFIVDRFQDQPRAMQLLWQQWPDGHQVQKATQLAFEWLGKQGDSHECQKHLRSIVETTHCQYRLALVELTRHLARKYPDRSVQDFASDQCRLAVSRVISESGSDADLDQDRAQQALEMMRSLENVDSLLASDSIRYRTRMRQQNIANASRPDRSKHRKSVGRTETSGPPIEQHPPLQFTAGHYSAFEMVDRQLFAVSRSHSKILAYRVVRPDDLSTMHAGKPAESIADPVLGVVDGLAEVLITREGPALRLASIRPLEWFHRFNVTAPAVGEDWIVRGNWPGNLQYVDSAASLNGRRFVGVQTSDGETNLLLFNQSGLTTRTHSLTHLIEASGLDELHANQPEYSSFDYPPMIPTAETTHVAAIDERIVVAAGSMLIVRPDTTTPILQNIGHAIHRISVSPRNTRKRIAVAHQGGIDVYWLEMGELHQQRLETEHPFQFALWMDGGAMFAISDRTLYRYRVGRKAVIVDGQTTLSGMSTIALLKLSRNVCGVADSTGLLERFT